MAKNYFQPGDNIDFVTAGNVTSGDVIVAGNLVGIAANTTIGAAQVNVFTIEGVWKIAKAAPLAITQGAKVYWSASNGNVSTTNTDVFMGYASAAALSADTICYVLLARGGS